MSTFPIGRQVRVIDERSPWLGLVGQAGVGNEISTEVWFRAPRSGDPFMVRLSNEAITLHLGENDATKV